MTKDKNRNLSNSEEPTDEQLERQINNMVLQRALSRDGESIDPEDWLQKAEKQRNELHRNAALVSVPYSHLKNCFNLLEGDEFNINTFFELAAYLELGVLFDVLAIVPDSYNKDDIFKDTGSAMKLLIENKLFIYLSGDDFTDFGDGRGEIISGVPDKSSVFSAVNYPEYFRNVLAKLQQFWVPSYHIPFEVLNHYLDLVKYEYSLRAYSSLISAYEELSSSLKKEIKVYEKYFGSKILYIPPIVTVILGRCSCPAEIPEAFLELRKEFKPLRKYLQEYQCQLRDSSQPLIRSIKAVNELEKALSSLKKTNADDNCLIVSEWHEGLSLLPDLDSIEKIDTSISKLVLKRPIEWIAHRIRNRRFMPLFNLKREFYRTHDYTRLIDKVFGVEIRERDYVDHYNIGQAFNRLEPK